MDIAVEKLLKKGKEEFQGKVPVKPSYAEIAELQHHLPVFGAQYFGLISVTVKGRRASHGLFPGIVLGHLIGLSL
jgi:hypothetical protein